MSGFWPRFARCSPIWILILAFPVSAMSEAGDGSSPDEIIRTLERSFAGITTVQTLFTQEKELALFDRKIKLTGRIVLENPGRLAWHVETPVKYSILIDKNVVRQWDEDTDRVQKTTLASNPVFQIVAEQLRHWFAGHYASLSKDYGIRVMRRKPVVLEFVPKPDTATSKAVKRVEVSLRKDERYVETILIEDMTGDRTLMRFSDTVLNGSVDDNDWEVKPHGR